ncbi:MarR family EPS-associated transcriptional regulator [Roseinatronobacter sp.]|uniref:MarR family EPS-associated transcriptional regulator n=1 Tax=Roseinatronobacter sp. TaxID=1945755 RepID=UPI0025FE4F30|nr:MarR family EPS-associated transcriptional regulator [Roseibaca sp.]
MALFEQNPDLSLRQLRVSFEVSLRAVNDRLCALAEKAKIKIGKLCAADHRCQYAYSLTVKGIGRKILMTPGFLKGNVHEYTDLKAETAELRAEFDAGERQS